MDLLSNILVNYKVENDKNIIQDNIDVIMDESDSDSGIDSDDSCDEEKIKVYNKTKETKKYLKNVINGNYTMINEVKKIKNKINKKYKCEYCKRYFSRKDNLKTHIKQVCKIKKTTR